MQENGEQIDNKWLCIEIEKQIDQQKIQNSNDKHKLIETQNPLN